MDAKKGKFQWIKKTTRKFTNVIKKFANFIGRRHIWSGLLAGFLWIFSSVFILTFQSLPEEVTWTVFFPLKLLVQLTFWTGLTIIDPFLFLIVAMLFGMLIGVIITYSIHRIRVWRHTHNLQKSIF